MNCILDDDEVDIEAEIQRELDALEDDNLHIEDVEDDVNSTVKANEVLTRTKYHHQNLCLSIKLKLIYFFYVRRQQDTKLSYVVIV